MRLTITAIKRDWTVKRTREKSGLTLIEIITVVAIIALLAGILIPAVNAVKTVAKEAKQEGQFLAINVALTAFKDPGVYGDYPPSDFTPGSIYGGAQKLAEALMGWDLLGFHSRSVWMPDGSDVAGGPLYDPADLSERKGPYLESGAKYAFTLVDLFPSYSFPTPLGTDRYVLCDVFGATKVTIPGISRPVKAGAPILYYKADIFGNTIDTIYNSGDNLTLVQAKEAVDGASVPPFSDIVTFYDYITDPKIPATTKIWPYNRSSYILISAGADGIYGTDDDIRNFGD